MERVVHAQEAPARDPAAERLAESRRVELAFYRTELEQSRKDGRTEGRSEAQAELARRLLARGMRVDEAAELLGIDVAALRQLLA